MKIIMKKILTLFIILITLSACSLNEEQTYTTELVPVAEVNFPTKFATDSITYIPMKYIKPTSCHLFNGIFYEATGLTRVVAIETIKVNQDNCQADNVTVTEINLKFKPIAEGIYHFKFFSGINTQGQDTFLEFDATVDH